MILLYRPHHDDFLVDIIVRERSNLYKFLLLERRYRGDFACRDLA